MAKKKNAHRSERDNYLSSVIAEEEMCEALERTMRTGEVIIAEADPENIEEGKLDVWTYHLRFVKPEEYFNVETPPSPPEYLDHDWGSQKEQKWFVTEEMKSIA